MQESTILGAYGVLFMLSILLTLVMMNIFIAVVSDVYGKAFESAQLEFEKTVVDYSFYNMRSNDIRDLMIDHYLAQVKDITKKKLKELAREIHKSEKETQPETLRRLLNRGNHDTAKQIQILDDKVQTIKNLIKKLERGGKGTMV